MSPTPPRPLALVLRGPGTNCDRETCHALELAGARAERVHVRALIDAPRTLDPAGLLVLPGGFSFGDDIAAGRVMATAMASRLGPDLLAFVARGGVVLGICNGFQILVRLGLLPGGSLVQTATLSDNASDRFESRWVTLVAGRSRCPFVEPGETYELPVAHREGRFVAPPEEIARLDAAGQIVLRYSSSQYPANPNGSLADIAGVCDPSGRVLGLMPHPERHVHRHHHPRWTRGEGTEPGCGLSIFRRAVEQAAKVGATAGSEPRCDERAGRTTKPSGVRSA